MSVSFSNIWLILRKSFDDWIEDKAPRLGASLAFYAAISIAPLLVIALSIAGFFFGEEAARGEIVDELQSLVGKEGGKAIEEMIENANKPRTGTLAAAFGIATLLFGASGVFGQLQDALNTIWEVKPKSGRGLWGFIKDRFLSLAMVMGVMFLLLVSLLVTAALSTLTALTERLPDAVEWLAPLANFAISFVVIATLFGIMFKWLPDVKIAWRDVWLGAILTALLFTIGKFAIGLYLGRSSTASSYGVAGSFVVLLLWTYYSAQILFFGAEFTQVYANQFGSRIVPAEDAEHVTEADRQQEGRAR
jgi:membrane protein